jgi:hypothetical protein
VNKDEVRAIQSGQVPAPSDEKPDVKPEDPPAE